MQILLNELSYNGTNGLQLTRQRASGKSKSLQAPDRHTELHGEKDALYTDRKRIALWDSCVTPESRRKC